MCSPSCCGGRRVGPIPLPCTGRCTVGVVVQVAGKNPHVTLLIPQGKIEAPHLDPDQPVAVALRQAALKTRPRTPSDEQPAPPPRLDPRGVITNGRFWEQLVVPAATLVAHPGEVEVRIEDNQAGGRSALLDHADGPVPLAAYVTFTAWHRHVEAGLLDDLGMAPSKR